MKLNSIFDIASKIGLQPSDLFCYGPYKAKIEPRKANKKSKLVLVTAITPTKYGEGKTTTVISLVDGLNAIGKKAIATLREPSLGPVFGLKGGATGGGKVTVEPSEDINLHFNGDMHALTSSIDLIAAVIDNHIYQGNELDIDPTRVQFKRALDVNDRSLREITIAQGPLSKASGRPLNGIERKDGFVITVAHELMAIMCLAKDEDDFAARLKNILVGYSLSEHKKITVGDLKVSKAVMKLMRQALKPNLVQTSNGSPALVHGGPFANIAHGCCSLISLNTASALSDIVVTEAGFGSDLGAEKFLDIVSDVGDLRPDLCVMVVTIRALKHHGGWQEDEGESVDKMLEGTKNLLQHISNMKKFGLDVVCNINKFYQDTPSEIQALEKFLDERNIPYALNDGFESGVEGCIDIANLVSEHLQMNLSNYHRLYNKNEPLKDKIEKICKEIYHSSLVEYAPLALNKLSEYSSDKDYSSFYVCNAKTPMSFSDNAKLLNAPKDFVCHVKDIELAQGAEFVIPIMGSIVRMPGLPKVPAACKMEEDD